MRKGRWIAIGAVVVLGTVLAYLAIDPPPPGRGGVTGVFRGIDDTGLPESRIGNTQLLVIPDATITDVWPGQREGSEIFHMTQQVELDDLHELFGAVLVDVQANGRFRITTGPGPTVVCLVRTAKDTRTEGCADLDLPERGTMWVARGELGFTSRVE